MGVVTGGGGGTAFNGGTITKPLLIAIDDPTADPLLQLATSGGEKALRIHGDGAGGIGVIDMSSDTALHTTGVTTNRVTGETAYLTTGLGSLGIYTDGAGTACIYDGMNAAVSSALLSASDFSLWLDDTNGASKLMVKAKSANGTVVSAAIALA